MAFPCTNMNTISYLTQPAVHMPMQQPPYFAVPQGSIPAGAVNMSYTGAAGIQVLYFYYYFFYYFVLLLFD